MSENTTQDSLPQIAKKPELPQEAKKISGEKLTGYVLLLAGLVIILIATYLAFRVLTGAQKPPQVFSVEAPSISLPLQGLQLPQESELSGTNLSSPEVKLFQDEVYNSFLNIGLFYLLMIFVSSTGLKISTIGVNLIKEIKVQIKKSPDS